MRRWRHGTLITDILSSNTSPAPSSKTVTKSDMTDTLYYHIAALLLLVLSQTTHGGWSIVVGLALGASILATALSKAKR